MSTDSTKTHPISTRQPGYTVNYTNSADTMKTPLNLEGDIWNTTQASSKQRNQNTEAFKKILSVPVDIALITVGTLCLPSFLIGMSAILISNKSAEELSLVPKIIFGVLCIPTMLAAFTLDQRFNTELFPLIANFIRASDR